MPENSKPRAVRLPDRKTFYLGLLLVISAIITFIALVLPMQVRLSQPQLEVGEVAPQDIVAPRALSYTSEILTQQQRDAAARAVLPVYTSADTSVARHQLERLRATLDFITVVRADSYASQEQKIADLAALEDIHLDQETASSILALGDSRWQAVQQEAIVVLEQVMRSTIREDRLDDARRNVPALVSLSLPEEQADIVAELVSGFVAPNSFFSEELTEAAREQARTTVTPVIRAYMQGETIVQRGQVISSTSLEALTQFGLIQPESRWQDYAAAGSLTLLGIILVVLYIRRKPNLLSDVRGLTVIAVLFLVFLLSGRLIIPGHTVIPYLYPLVAFSLTVASLFGAQPALILTLLLSIFFAYDISNALDLTIYYLISGFLGVLTLGQARRVSSFFLAGVSIAVGGALVIIAFRLPQPTTDVIGLATLLGVAVLNGVAASSLTILLQFFLAQMLGLTTALQLMEISRPDHPLLQYMLRNAPGTYQHSLQVANLAEQAAEKVGADTLLTRVGALYHDAGKAKNPIFFIENQVAQDINPHDELDPVTSAAIIIRHVSGGLELARQYRLPRRIQDFIAEHHGTMLARYQLAKAIQAIGGDERKVDEELFRYPGPRPQSRETAILMLADGSEARVRAERPKDEDSLREVIRNVVDNRLASDQLDDTDLTLKNLDTIVESFTTTLRGMYHPRIEYPSLKEIPAAQRDTTPTLPVHSRQSADQLGSPSTEIHSHESSSPSVNIG